MSAIVGSITGSEWQETNERSSGAHQAILVLKNEGHSLRGISKTLKLSHDTVFSSLHRTASHQSRDSRPVGRDHEAKMSKRTNTLVCVVKETDIGLL